MRRTIARHRLVLARPWRCAGAGLAPTVAGGARLKDVASLQGPAATPAVGYGLVVGLNKTGDRRQTIFSAQTLASMLERFGVAVSPDAMKVENIAAVIVTAEIGPYTQTGAPHRRDGLVDRRRAQPAGRHAAADAAARARRRASWRWRRARSRSAASAPAAAATRVAVNHLTVGRVPRGALVQAARPAALAPARRRCASRSTNPTSPRPRAWPRRSTWSSAPTRAHAVDAGAVRVQVPAAYTSSLAELIARLEPLPVEHRRAWPGW